MAKEERDRVKINMFKELDNRKVIKEPANMLMERRLPNVRDWNRLENDSRKNRIVRKNSN